LVTFDFPCPCPNISYGFSESIKSLCNRKPQSNRFSFPFPNKLI
jgi:hypothetical protein